MTPTDWFTAMLLGLGTIFFIAGAVGLIRFPDTYTRLHIATKTDNVGLGLIVFGLAVQSGSWSVAGKLVLIWLLVMLAGASVAYLVANGAISRGISVWKR